MNEGKIFEIDCSRDAIGRVLTTQVKTDETIKKKRNITEDEKYIYIEEKIQEIISRGFEIDL